MADPKAMKELMESPEARQYMQQMGEMLQGDPALQRQMDQMAQAMGGGAGRTGGGL